MNQERQYLGPRMTCRKLKNESLAMLVVGATLATSTLLTQQIDNRYNQKFDPNYSSNRRGYTLVSGLCGSLIGGELALYFIYRKREKSWIGHDPTEGGSQ